MLRFERRHKVWLLLFSALVLLYVGLPRSSRSPGVAPPTAVRPASSPENGPRGIASESDVREEPGRQADAAPEKKRPAPMRVERPREAPEPFVAASPPSFRAGTLATELPFREGDTITYDEVDQLEDYLPPALWAHRDQIFYEGMELEIGPFYRDYSEPPAFESATRRFQSLVTLGRDGALAGYVAGRPFPREIDCADPAAGLKIIWNLVKRWDGDGASATYSLTYWDHGQQLPLYYEGTSRKVNLKHRVEPRYADSGHDIFANEKRLYAFGIEVAAPFDARGILMLTYRYASSDGPLDEAKKDDTWIYYPDLRRIRRFSSAQHSDSVAGTDFSFDDLGSFSGIPPRYSWVCSGQQDVLAPMGSRALGYPYSGRKDFGPYGVSFTNGRWELRRAYVIRFHPRRLDHPYSFEDLWIDSRTYEPLYGFAYDRKKELWKIIWHDHRWSEDWREGDPRFEDGDWYRGWESVPDPCDLRVVSDVILNVQAGTATRIEFWDNHGTPLPTRGEVRRYIDVGRLNKGH